MEKYRQNITFENFFFKLRSSLLNFILALLNQPIDDDNYASPLISGLAILGANLPKETWLNPNQYTKKISAIITVSRILIVYKAYLLYLEEIRDFRLKKSFSKGEAKENSKSIFENTKILTKNHLLIIEFDFYPKLFN